MALKRGGIVLGWAAIVAAIVIASVPAVRSALVGDLFSSGSSTSSDRTLAPIRPQSESSGEPNVGDLAGSYFTVRQARELGFEVDPTHVRYAPWVDPKKLRSVGLPPDGIPSIDGPRFQSVRSAGQWLEPDDVVLTVEHGGEAKAYPIRILNWHEIANDTIGGVPIAATYCPLCNSGVVFKRPQFDGTRAAFGTSGRLYNSNLVMYDRVTGTFWDQITGRPMVGPMVGKVERLGRLPSSMARWAAWKRHHPDAKVLERPSSGSGGDRPSGYDEEKADFVPDYSYNPYADYASSDYGTYGTVVTDDRLVPKERITGVSLKGGAKAYRKSAVRASRLINDFVGGSPVVVAWNPQADDVIVFKRKIPQRAQPLEFKLRDGHWVDEQTGTTWCWNGEAESGPLADLEAQLERVTSTTTYWFAWAAIHPDTELYTPRAGSSDENSDD